MLFLVPRILPRLQVLWLWLLDSEVPMDTHGFCVLGTLFYVRIGGCLKWAVQKWHGPLIATGIGRMMLETLGFPGVPSSFRETEVVN